VNSISPFNRSSTSAAEGRIFSLSVLEYIVDMLSNSVLHGAVGRELPCVCVCVLC
jgi:hypothetical protein